MSKLSRARVEPQFRADEVTIWIARSDGPMRSYSARRGPRTVAALSELLATLDANGFPSTIEIESRACGPIEMTVADLVNLGVVAEELPERIARRHLESVKRRSRHRRTLASVVDILARPVVALARLTRGSV
jgi:hypothetical protein